MTKSKVQTNFSRRQLLGGLALLTVTQPVWAIAGVWRRTAVRTEVVVGATVSAEAAASANASKQAAATASAQSAAAASAAAAQQAAASANQAAAQAKAATDTKTPQQKLAELQSLFDQKLINQSDYDTAKAAIISQMLK